MRYRAVALAVSKGARRPTRGPRPRGGITLSDADWLHLAADAGLPPGYLPRLLQSWQDASMGAAFLEQRDGDIWTLGPEHATAVAFIAKRLELAVQHRQRAGSGGGAQRST